MEQSASAVNGCAHRILRNYQLTSLQQRLLSVGLFSVTLSNRGYQNLLTLKQWKAWYEHMV